MKPDEQDDRRMGTPLIQQRSFVHTPPQASRQDNSQAAAANIVRSQIDSIYSNDQAATTETVATPAPAAATTPAPAAAAQPAQQQSELRYKSPYQKTQMNTGHIQGDQWKQYHSAWQDYYQKYYERYYVGQVQRTSQALEARAQQPAASGPQRAAQPQPAQQPAATETFDRDEAMFDLRTKLHRQISSSATKARKSRHFLPISAAVCVMVLFLFMQYNRILFSNVQAYISPGSIDAANIIIDPNSEVAVGAEPKLIIPKINVDVPIDFAATPDNDSQMAAMSNGVAFFGIPGANSKPGQIGNMPISGHSSNDFIDQGQYKFIFARLEALKPGDTIYLNYESKRYVYAVTKREVVKPSDIGKLVYETDKPVLTLITCTPLGTAINRLLVTAEQISPSTEQATAAPIVDPEATEDAVMPGNSPTFLQRIFGGGN